MNNLKAINFGSAFFICMGLNNCNI